MNNNIINILLLMNEDIYVPSFERKIDLSCCVMHEATTPKEGCWILNSEASSHPYLLKKRALTCVSASLAGASWHNFFYVHCSSLMRKIRAHHTLCSLCMGASVLLGRLAWLWWPPSMRKCACFLMRAFAWPSAMCADMRKSKATNAHMEYGQAPCAKRSQLFFL